MALTISDILELHLPFDITNETLNDFVFFYVEVQRLITLTQNRGTDILNLYDVIISTIDGSLLSNLKGLKTSITESYQIGKENARLNNEDYYLKTVSFVKELQLLVLVRYDSIDDFYEERGITVSQIFADISQDAGHPISSQYIEDIS